MGKLTKNGYFQVCKLLVITRVYKYIYIYRVGSLNPHDLMLHNHDWLTVYISQLATYSTNDSRMAPRFVGQDCDSFMVVEFWILLLKPLQ